MDIGDFILLIFYYLIFSNLPFYFIIFILLLHFFIITLLFIFIITFYSIFILQNLDHLLHIQNLDHGLQVVAKKGKKVTLDFKGVIKVRFATPSPLPINTGY